MERRTFLKQACLAGVAMMMPNGLWALNMNKLTSLEGGKALFDGPLPPADGTYSEKLVFENEDVKIRQIDEHTWEGNGHLYANETIYLLEGEKEAILLDAGTHIPGLRKILEGLTSKPITLIATHVHPDHTGDAIHDWDSIWINAADEVNVPLFMKDYKGEKKYLTDGQIFDMGARQIEVIFTPGHTPGSTTFLEKAKKVGYSGDAFGSGNLLIMTNLTTVMTTCEKMSYFIEKYGIEKMYPGHYFGVNCETPQRIKDIGELSWMIRDGLAKGEDVKPSFGNLNHVLSERGVRLNYSDEGIR